MDYKNKKIMFITGALSNGGAERVISILASSAAELGANVALVVLRDNRNTYEISNKVNVFQIKEDDKNFKVIRRIFKLREFIKVYNPGTLIPFLPIISLYTLFANIGIKKRLVFSERGDPNKKLFGKGTSLKDTVANLIMRKLKFFRIADWMVFQTPEAQLYYGKKIIKKSNIIPNPIDKQKLPKRFIGIRKDVIVAVGRLSEEKNFSMLLKAFSIFVKKHPTYKLSIYGEGNEYVKLLNEAKELNIDNKVSFHGFVKDVINRIADAKMYVSSSNHEGISNSLLEAMCMGIPTIATDCPIGGSRMFIKSHYNGILIEMNDTDGLCNAMYKIAEDNNFAEKLSTNSIKIIKELDADKICKEWLKIS